MSILTELQPCLDPDHLHAWVEQFLELNVPRRPVCQGHNAPFDYLCRAYFEPTRDLVVWAPRGGGKTRLAAVATLLDLLHKPPAAVRILGGSLEQSLKMWEHLLPDLEWVVPSMLGRRPLTGRRVVLTNRSTAAVLTQSQRAVRGLRVQKLRCDEVELFQPEIWQAAQLVTRSLQTPHALIGGSIEAISTFHSPFGLMSRIIDRARQTGTTVLHWCLLEVLERCPPQRDCKTCPLWEDCRGVAKKVCNGFVLIDDAIAMKRRVSHETWQAEMLCRRPAVQGCVFPGFDPMVHVVEKLPPATSVCLAIDFGFHAPFVCLWIADDGQVCHVIDEYAQPQRTLDDHLEQIESRPWPLSRRVCCDPAGAGRNDQTAESNVQLLRRRGYRVHKRRSLIVEGLELIRAALRPAAGLPRLFIHPRCKNLIAALQQYHYPCGGGELPVKDGVHDHFIDALRYFFVNRSRSVPIGPRRY